MAYRILPCTKLQAQEGSQARTHSLHDLIFPVVCDLTLSIIKPYHMDNFFVSDIFVCVII